jgi:hypothetical protein
MQLIPFFLWGANDARKENLKAHTRISAGISAAFRTATGHKKGRNAAGILMALTKRLMCGS